jgi:hypothetical protein
VKLPGNFDVADLQKRWAERSLPVLGKVDFAQLRKRLQVRSYLALTLESERIVITALRSDASQGAPRPPLTVAVGADEVVRHPEKAGQSVALALAAAGWRERRCVVCVPPGWALSTATDLPAMTPDDLRGFLEIRAEQEFSLPAGDLRLGYCVYTLAGGQPRATLAVVSGKRLKAVETLVETLGKKLVSVSLALAEALTDPQPTLHFQANGSHTDVIVTGGGGAIAALRSLASPLGTEEAPFDPGAFCREVRITLGRLPISIRKEVIQAQFGGSEASARRLCLEIRGDLQRMGISAPDGDEAAADPAMSNDPGAAAAAAGRLLRGETVPFEFVVPEVRRWEATLTRLNIQKNRRVAGAVVGLILLPLFLFFVRSEMESHLNNEWDAMRDNVAQLDALQQKIHRFRPWFNPAPETVQALETLIAAFPEQGDVWAKSIQITPGYHVTCTCFARNYSVLQPMLDRLRARPGITGLQVGQTRGDKPVQFSITYLWQPPHEG